jgi:sporulation-control protein spo0M
MFGKVKRWLGIEGVKIEVETSDFFRLQSGSIEGQIRILSMSDQTVYRIELAFIEKYKRGRSQSKLIDEYTLGQILLEKSIDIKEGEETYIPFSLPFVPLQSEMDILEEKNIIVKGVVAAAKMLKGVQSEYRLEAKAYVKGTALNPIAIKVLQVEN